MIQAGIHPRIRSANVVLGPNVAWLGERVEINKTASPLILPFPAFSLLACDSAKSIVILALGLRWRTKHQNPRPKDAIVVK